MTTPDTALHRVSTVDALVGALRSRILTGQIGPGAQMRELELTSEFGVGRHSLRAALQALTHEGLLHHEPNRGVFVPEFSARDVEDLFLLRAALETEAARLIVARRAPLDDAVAAVEELERLTGDEPWDEVIEIDLRFHRSLIDAVGSSRMSRAFRALQTELRLLIAQLKQDYDRPDAVGAEHRLVLEAVLGRSPQRAVKAVREHLEVGVRDIVGTTRPAANRDRSATA
jgi:DNA-binding GntR family transcriptional regulator